MPEKWTIEEDTILINLYNKARRDSILSKLYDRNWKSVIQRANKLNLAREISANYSNIELFDNFTEESSYILGFIAADGCINEKIIRGKYKNYVLSIGLSINDITHLQKIRDIIAPGKNIYTYKEFNKNGMVYERCDLRVGSNYMCKKLISLGVTPRKSFTFRFPEIPEKYIKDFVRGYFDGDGCIRYRRAKNKSSQAWLMDFVGSYDFLSSLSIIFYNKFGLNNKINKKTNSDIYYIRYTTCQALQICNFIYRDAGIKLDRKYDEYLKLLQYKDHQI